MPNSGKCSEHLDTAGKSMLEIYADGQAGWVGGKCNPYHSTHDIGYGIWECGWMDARRSIGLPSAAPTGEPA